MLGMLKRIWWDGVGCFFPRVEAMICPVEDQADCTILISSSSILLSGSGKLISIPLLTSWGSVVILETLIASLISLSSLGGVTRGGGDCVVAWVGEAGCNGVMNSSGIICGGCMGSISIVVKIFSAMTGMKFAESKCMAAKCSVESLDGVLFCCRYSRGVFTQFRMQESKSIELAVVVMTSSL